MPRYPHTRLFTDPHRTVVLSGPHIQVLDSRNGRVLHSTTTFAREDEEAAIKSGPIRCSGISKDGRYLATAGDDKKLKIWDLESLALLSARMLPKKPTSIEFSKNMYILVSDKFGDVFRYTFHPSNAHVEENGTRDALSSHENPSGGELILGHTSLLTSSLLSPDEKFIITADRDEHIRVSWYPEGYVIESYCLGHRRYVSAIHIPVELPAILISGGGDLVLKTWDWKTGHLQRDITVYATVEPFIKVRPRRNRHGPLSKNYDQEEVVESRCGNENAGEKEQVDVGVGTIPEDSKVHSPLEGDSNSILSTTPTVFVVHKIGSFRSGGDNHIVFSAVGATAIFEFILTDVDDQPDIRHHDFGQPVIDFIVSEEGMVWALLDADFVEESCVNECPRKLIEIVQWTDGRFIDVGSTALLDSLNTVCSLPATVEDLKVLDLYSDLTSLPKGIDGEHGSQLTERLELNHEPVEDELTGQDASSSAVGLTKRALGRLKHKRALNQLHLENADDCGISGPNTKKIRAVLDNKDPHSTP